MEVLAGSVEVAKSLTTIRAWATVALSTTVTLQKIASACEKKNQKKNKTNKQKKSKIQQELTLVA